MGHVKDPRSDNMTELSCSSCGDGLQDKFTVFTVESCDPSMGTLKLCGRTCIERALDDGAHIWVRESYDYYEANI
jgi:hypothetical protein